MLPQDGQALSVNLSRVARRNHPPEGAWRAPVADLAALLDAVGRDQLMDLMLERLRARFLDHADDAVEVRARDGFRYDKPALGLVEWMPTHETGGPVVIKMVGYHPANPVQRALPSVIATSSMWDTESGHLVAIADATLLTALRTGAASGIATDLLTPRGPVSVGVVGLGALVGIGGDFGEVIGQVELAHVLGIVVAQLRTITQVQDEGVAGSILGQGSAVAKATSEHWVDD